MAKSNVGKALAAHNGERFRVTAIVERFGHKNGCKGAALRTVLLKDVRNTNTGAGLADDLWFTVGVWARELSEGDRIAFTARTSNYELGYRGWRDDAWDAPPPSIDWRLE